MKNLSRGVIFIAIFCLLTANFVPAAEKIDINTASLEDLMKIIHIGKTRAIELITLRPFTSLDDLLKIKGIGEQRLKDIKSQGLAWIAPSNMLKVGPSTSEPPEPEDQTPVEEENISPPEVFEAAASIPAQKTHLPFVVAGVLAVLSGVIILVLKKRLK